MTDLTTQAQSAATPASPAAASADSGPAPGRWARLGRVLRRRVVRREPTRVQRGMAILVVLVTTAVIGSAAADFAYNAQVELEAAANSRDMLRAEYMARAGLQLGQLLTAVQASMASMLKQLDQYMPGMGDAIVVTDYAGFLAQVFGGDKDARAGMGAMLGLDLGDVEGLGSPKGSSFDLNIASEEGKYVINCAGGLAGINTTSATNSPQNNLYKLLYNLIRPLRYDRMFNVPDRDGVMITREDLPIGVIDWSDIDQLRFNPASGGSSGTEDRYDKGRDRYEAHNSYFDTAEELMLVRGISEDFWAAFGEMFTVYRSSDCKLLASGVQAEAWPLIAAMIAASSSDRNAVYDPNTAAVAQQVAGLLKTGLPTLKAMAQSVKIPECKSDSSCNTTTTGSKTTTSTSTTTATSSTSDGIELLSNLICSSNVSMLPGMGDMLSSMTGATMAPKPAISLRPIPMCKGMLGQFLKEKASGNKSPRRFYRIDATGTIQRSETKSTQVHIRGVWDSQSNNSNPLCNNDRSCLTGTWVYFRID